MGPPLNQRPRIWGSWLPILMLPNRQALCKGLGQDLGVDSVFAEAIEIGIAHAKCSGSSWSGVFLSMWSPGLGQSTHLMEVVSNNSGALVCFHKAPYWSIVLVH